MGVHPPAVCQVSLQPWADCSLGRFVLKLADMLPVPVNQLRLAVWDQWQLLVSLQLTLAPNMLLA